MRESPRATRCTWALQKATLDRLLAGGYSDPDYARFVKLLRRHRDNLLDFMDRPGIEATNNTVGRKIRQAVIIRKTHGFNRTVTDKRNHAVLASTIRPCFRLKRDFVRYVLSLLRQRGSGAGFRRVVTWL